MAAKKAGKASSNDKSSKGAKHSQKEYEVEIEKLHVELVKLQYWVKEKGLKVIVLFEGRDAAGKGGVIKRITERPVCVRPLGRNRACLRFRNRNADNPKLDPTGSYWTAMAWSAGADSGLP